MRACEVAPSFRAAAKRLGRVQSAVSHAVAGLETELEVSLFDRSARRPVLTPEGRSLLHDARSLLIKANTLRARAQGLGGGVELKISIALDPQFPLPVIAAALQAMQQAYPTVGVETWTAPLGAGIAALREKRCTLAITAANLPDQAIDLEFLCNLRRAAVAAPHHPLADAAGPGKRLMRDHLADHIQIVVPDPSQLTAGQDFGVLSPGTWRAGDNESKRALDHRWDGLGQPAFVACGRGSRCRRRPASDNQPSLPSGPSGQPDPSSARGPS